MTKRPISAPHQRTGGRHDLVDLWDRSLFEMRGMADHSGESYVLGARSSGYLVRQTVITLEETTRAIADGSIQAADASFWDTLPTQGRYDPDE